MISFFIVSNLIRQFFVIYVFCICAIEIAHQSAKRCFIRFDRSAHIYYMRTVIDLHDRLFEFGIQTGKQRKHGAEDLVIDHDECLMRLES